MVAERPVSPQEITLLGEFVVLLKAEQEALVRAEPAALSAINEKKLTLLADINRHEEHRTKLLRPVAAENTNEAMQRWIAKNAGDKLTADLWQALMNLAREAKRMHELNGRLIAMHLQQTGELLAVLKRSEHNTLYGANGQAHQSSGSRIIDQA